MKFNLKFKNVPSRNTFERIGHLARPQWVYYYDVIRSTMASQITGVSIVYSTICSGAVERNHQSSASLSFVRGIHRGPMDSLHKGQWRGKCFHWVMSSCNECEWDYCFGVFFKSFMPYKAKEDLKKKLKTTLFIKHFIHNTILVHIIYNIYNKTITW